MQHGGNFASNRRIQRRRFAIKQMEGVATLGGVTNDGGVIC